MDVRKLGEKSRKNWGDGTQVEPCDDAALVVLT